MTAQQNKLKVAIISAYAGSGHNAAADYLYQVLKTDERLELVKFIHPDRRIDKFHNNVNRYLPGFQDMMFKVAPNILSDILLIFNLDMVDDTIDFLRKENPDIIISTYWGLIFNLKVAKWITGRKSKDIMCLLDYGKQPQMFQPFNIHLRADAYFVFEDMSAKSLREDLSVAQDFIIKIGYQARREFYQLIQTIKTKTEAKKQLAVIYPTISAKKKTILIVGGGGGQMYMAKDLLEQIAQYQNESNQKLLENFQFLVVCGTSEKLRKKLLDNQKNLTGWENIIPLPWMDANQYALVQLACDYPVLLGIASATMHELMVTDCLPMLVHKIKGVQERGYLDFIEQNKLGEFYPDSEDIIKEIFHLECIYDKNQKESLLLAEENLVNKLADTVVEFDHSYPKLNAIRVYNVGTIHRLTSNSLRFITSSLFHIQQPLKRSGQRLTGLITKLRKRNEKTVVE